MLQLLSSILTGVIYSIAGWKWSWIRSYLICPIILILMIFSVGFASSLLYPILLSLSWLIGYGYNSPLQKFFRKLGVPDFQNKILTRTINALAIAGSALVIQGFSFWFWINFSYFIPLYVYLGAFNPCKDWLGLEATRWEEFFIGMTSVLIPFYMIW